MKFTEIEKQQYQEQGYVVRKDAYSLEEVDRLGNRVRGLIRQVEESEVLNPEQKQKILMQNELSDEEAEHYGEAARIHSIFRLHLYSQMVREYIRDRMKLDVARDLLGEDLFCPNDLYFFKAPGVGREIGWHQDSWYFRNTYESTNGESIDKGTLGTWVAVDDATLENGCLWVIPGSHKRGVVEHSAVEAQQTLQVKFNADIAKELEKDAIPVEARRGTLIYFNNALLHSSKSNLSNLPRRAYVVHYMKATIRHTEQGSNQLKFALKYGLGIPEGYISGGRFDRCVQTPDDEQCLDWDSAIGRKLTREDLVLPALREFADSPTQPLDPLPKEYS